MTELSDAEVFGAPQPTAAPTQPNEMSDTEVMGPAAGPSPPISGPGGWSFGSGSDGVAVAKNVYPQLGPILSAFGHGAKDGWGDEPLGLAPDAVKYLSDKGIFGPAKGGYQNPFQAFNELLAQTVVGAVQIAGRAGSAALGAYQAGTAETGEQVGQPQLGRDLAAMPEAFFGSPHPMGEIKARSGLPRDEPVGMPANPILGPAGFDAYHGSPYSFDAFSTAHIDAGEGNQTYGHGLYFAENPTVAGYYKDSIVKYYDKEGKVADLNPDQREVAGILAKSGGDFDAARAEVARTYEPKDRAGALKDLDTVKELKPSASALYQVRINVDQDRMLDWHLPLSEQPDIAAAFDKITPQPGWLARQIEGMKVIRHEIATDPNSTGGKAYGALSRLLGGDDKASAALAETGVPGIKYLDSGSRAVGDGTRNFVVFNEGDIQITHKNGEPIPTPLDRINQARDLGVIGLDKPDLSAASPAEKAEAAVPGGPDGGVKIDLTHIGQGQSLPAPKAAAAEAQQLPSLDERMDAMGSERHDLTVNDRMEDQIDLHRALSTASLPGISFERARGSAKWAMENGREDIAQTILDRLDREADRNAAAKPGVAKDNPRYDEIQKGLDNLAKETRAQADALSEELGLKPGREPPKPEKAGNIRLDQIGINADAKDVILDAAKNNDDFNQARQGNVPLAQVESLSGASGVPSETLSGNDGLGRLMHNDAVVRTWLQAFHQATDEIADQMQTVARTGDEADIANLRDMKLRFQHMQEQVSGLTAEAGRTLGVFREFYANKGKAEALGKMLEDNPGLDAESLKKLADTGSGLNDPAALARYLHDSNQPTFWDKYLYYWVNALISGPVTHLKYVGANAAFGAYEAGVVTPVAGALGAARRLVSGGTDGVYAGEAAARTWGLLAGTPDALKSAWTAAKNNVMTPFENEVAGKQVNPLTQVRPSAIGGKLGFALGIPGRSAAGIHSFFRSLGYRAEIEAQAYRQAAREGLSPLDGQAFWERRAALADQPTDAMMNAGIENGNHLTFIGEQGTFGQAISKLANTRMGPGGMQPFKLILPFTHIPGQILRAGLEQTPAAFLDVNMRADLLGKNGAVAADTARARLIAGGAVSAMVANWAVNDTVTGYGPTDQTERAQWLRTHEPYSVRLGGWWYSYNKFGPIGDLVGLVANLAEVGPKVGEGEYGEAAGHVMKATSRMLEDEVGMQGLVNLLDAMSDPDKKMTQFVAGQAASNLPMSSLLRQGASITDPYMRVAKTFVDELRYSIPWARQDLLPKRDWLGQPMTNPGYASIIRQRAVNADPVDVAVSQLRSFRPAPPEARIGGVALPPKMYDQYQATAGALTRASLEPIVSAPNWGGIPPGVREMIIHGMVESARKTAQSMMQATHQELIWQGISNRNDKITGAKPGKLMDATAP